MSADGRWNGGRRVYDDIVHYSTVNRGFVIIVQYSTVNREYKDGLFCMHLASIFFDLHSTNIYSAARHFCTS